MPTPVNYAALASSSSVTPRTRAALGRLLLEQTEGTVALPAQESAPADASLALNPVFQKPEEQSFSLAGTSPVGGTSRTGQALLGGDQTAAESPAGGGSKLGRALLGGEPAEESATPKSTIPDFWETKGGKAAAELLEKRKRLSWLAPDFIANRLERDLKTAMELGRSEVAAASTRESSSQAAADRLDRKTSAEKESTRRQAAWQEEDSDRDFRRDLDAQRIALDKTRVGLEERRVAADEGTRQEMARHREALLALRKKTPAGGATEPKAEYDPTASDPAATGVFRKFAQKLIEKDPEMTPEDVRRAQVNASGAGALPKMQSRPGDRPRIAVDKQGRRFYVFNDGRVEPAG